MARPRDPETDRRILVAAARCFERDGYEAATMAAIAQEAGVGKPAVYLRWPSKAQLMFELTIRASRPEELPDAGALRDDLVIMLERLVASLLATPREVLADRVAALVADRAFFDDVWVREAGPVSDAVFSLWERAAARGEVLPDAPGRRIVDDLSYVVLWRTMVFHRPPDHDELVELVERNLAAASMAPSAMMVPFTTDE